MLILRFPKELLENEYSSIKKLEMVNVKMDYNKDQYNVTKLECFRFLFC